jgi:glycosyltransferase involved in cell wall biosynthesis
MIMVKDFLTVVIPTKNESELIDITLGHLNKQHNINGTKVIICDCSDDNTLEIVNSGKYKNLNIIIIEGGLPSVARNNGAKLCDTPYVLFLDADMFLVNTHTLDDVIKFMIEKQKHLLTCRFRCRGKYSLIFPIFEFFRDITIWSSPCAIGGFMLFDISEFNKVGGFVNDDKFAEDFHLSMKISANKFHVSNHKIYTTDRRFKKKGLFYMMKMSLLSFINKNNPEFFKHDHSYWV